MRVAQWLGHGQIKAVMFGVRPPRAQGCRLQPLRDGLAQPGEHVRGFQQQIELDLSQPKSRLNTYLAVELDAGAPAAMAGRIARGITAAETCAAV